MLPGFGSCSSAPRTVATFVRAGGIVLTAGASTRAEMTSVCARSGPTPTVPTVQMPVPASNEPWLGVAAMNWRPAGSVSVSVTLFATSGPSFESVIVKVTTSPTLGRVSLTVFTTAKSASSVVTVASSRSLV